MTYNCVYRVKTYNINVKSSVLKYVHVNKCTKNFKYSHKAKNDNLYCYKWITKYSFQPKAICVIPAGRSSTR